MNHYVVIVDVVCLALIVAIILRVWFKQRPHR